MSESIRSLEETFGKLDAQELETIEKLNCSEPETTINGEDYDRSSTPTDDSGTGSQNNNVNPQFRCELCHETLVSPRILLCLHEFCSACLEKKAKETQDEDCTLSLQLLECPECGQTTPLGERGVSGLELDHVISMLIDIDGIKEGRKLLCTSCKFKENAVARCNDCATFLCANCVTAHNYMRCFEKHQVVAINELQSLCDDHLKNKPLACQVHPADSLQYFCSSCQVLACTECLYSQHKDHPCDRVQDVAGRYSSELQQMITQGQSKLSVCQTTADQLMGQLQQLEEERQDAKSAINEAFHSYKAIIKEIEEQTLKELEELHQAQRSAIMEAVEKVNKTQERLEHAYKFTERTLTMGSGAQMLALRHVITSQLLTLINNTPAPDVSVSIKFSCNIDEFRQAVKANFGTFSEAQKPIKKTTPPPVNSSNQEEKAISRQMSIPRSYKEDIATTFVPSSGVRPVQGIGSLSMTTPSSTVVPEPIGHFNPDYLNEVNSTTYTKANSLGPIGSNLMNSAVGGDRAPPPGLGSRSSSRNSFSPTMCDSGISMEAAANSVANGTNTFAQALTKQISSNVPSTDSFSTSHWTNAFDSTGSVTSSSKLYSIDMPGFDYLQSNNNPFGGTRSSSSSTLFNNLDTVGTSFNTRATNSVLNSQASSFIPTSYSASSDSAALPARSQSRMSTMQIRWKFGQLGPSKSQFNSPHGFCLGVDEEIVVADTNNHRVQIFDKSGEFMYQFGTPGRDEGQLWYPRKVAVIKNMGKFVVCDRGSERSRMQIFTKTGHFMKKIAIRYIDIVAGLAIKPDGSIVAVDSVSPTVFVISDNGDLEKWFDCSNYMREPSDIAVNSTEFFVCDFKGHCVVVFNFQGEFQRRIGCESITNFPNGIDISSSGDILVGDSHGNRFHVAIFQKDGTLIGEFECPYVKVSRCCGLKVTSEGYVVT
ncbi:DgyrCDS3375 [Dimorphilus gyrociliatus]|uniref:DgyrCDS3375 n=1 Tax=Dimorphilus gyrociliatus TaxID=2664684 RepID=A0A7I8VD09_9ANNE|nr:DgyrCDS3375 [Dimorphilus gyrociliatus]